MLVGEDAAYGYVDDTTPELAIAVDPQRTGDGIGSQLLKRLLLDAERMFPAVSLSVRADNPARRLYERFGFQPVADRERTNRVGGTSLTRVRRFTGR
jgi:ribosomal protein S18 acetylase RimI-like enzyme